MNHHPTPHIPGHEPPGDWLRRAVARYERPLLLYAARVLGDGDTARDAVQETFLRLCRQDRAAVEPRLAEWLFAVCRNLAIDARRKENRMTALDQAIADATPSQSPAPPSVVEAADASVLALHLLDQLPEQQREVIRLKFQQGLSYKQISAVTGHSVSNVGFLIHTGLKTLRHRMTVNAAARA